MNSLAAELLLLLMLLVLVLVVMCATEYELVNVRQHKC
jgi:hypothetical protein